MKCKKLSSTLPFPYDEVDVSNEVDSLFTNIPKERRTIKNIAQTIDVQKKLLKICPKLNFKRLLVIYTTDFTFIFNNLLLSVTFIWSKWKTIF